MKNKYCQWFEPPEDLDGTSESCSKPATHTTCVIRDGVVCEEHKCRCSKPLEKNEDDV